MNNGSIAWCGVPVSYTVLSDRSTTHGRASWLSTPPHGMITSLQDQMEKGSVHNDKLKTSEGKPSTSELTGALAMLGLEHAHVIHEADPDTKVPCLTLPQQL